MSNADLQEKHAQIEAEFACTHTTRETRKRIIKDNRISYVSQCIRCGHTSTPIKKELALASGHVLSDYDEALQGKWDSEKSKKYKEAFESARQETTVVYHDYLKTVDWEKLRKKVFKRSGGVCEGCLENQATQVHHVTYEHVGNEFMWEVVAICEECHKRVHNEDIS